MTQHRYHNRYGSTFTFTLQEDGNILWEGDFKWCRYGWPNDYKKAYEAYFKAECGPPHDHTLSFEQFKIAVHEYNEDYSQKEITRKYGPLVKSDRTKIDMVDPSGGPYISGGCNMEMFGRSFKGMLVDSFKLHPKGYLIIIQKST